MDDNGILERVQGTYVARAALTLPPAATAEDRDYPVEINANSSRPGAPS